MGKQLIKGEKIDISKINSSSNKFELVITYKNNNENSYDIDTFVCVCENNNRINKKEIIFYNNVENTDKSICFVDCFTDNTENKKTFQINLNSANISKLIIGYSIYKSNLCKQSSADITLKLINRTLQTEVFTMSMQSDIINNNAGVVGEVYKYKDVWKFNAIEYNSPNDLMSTIKTLFNVILY
ncbi:MAG: hypothetical protein A2Y18_06155 [Clostridiales bacterium GWD2_32_19]|nr:MAG: hypothetical protein A2Y18_06155 [Clostridiales bacterium GWD2_32_19]